MNKKILIYNSGGGLGDSIQLFSLILTLQNHFKDSKFYYLGAHENHFLGKLKEYNITIETLNLNLKYFGFRWWHIFCVRRNILKLGINRFDLVIDCQSKFRNTLILKKIPTDILYSKTLNYRFCTDTEAKEALIKTENSDIINDLKIILKKDIKKIDYDIKNLSKKYHDEAIKLLPDKNYIGISLTQGNIYRKKSWPLNKFIILSKQLIANGKKVVFFIEKNESELIKNLREILPEAFFPEVDSKIACPALVSALACRLEKIVSIDNGIMHMLALAKVPMVVLFGPTNSKKFAPNHKNVKILDSKKLYNSKDISKIKVSDVYKEFIF